MNARTRVYSAFLALVLFSFSACLGDDSLEAKLDEYLKPLLKEDLFSGSILVARDGEIVLAKGYGFANREHVVPNAPETKFRLGSITKQFTALAIMILQERGLLSVDDPLTKFIPDYPNGERITVYHLLTHTSGIPSFTNFPDYVDTMVLPTTLEKTIARFKDKPLEFEPGERFNYSNSGYILLSYIVETVSGKSYEAFVRENIFEPLGMKDTGYDHNQKVLRDRADGYTYEGNDLVNAAYIDMSVPSGAGALYSTVGDLFLWDRSLYMPKLISEDSLEKMFTPFKDGYAYGWAVSNLFGKKVIGHSGGINGFVSNIRRFVDDDVLIVVLCNLSSSNAEKVGRDVAAMVFGEDYKPPSVKKAVEIDPNILKDYAGRYQLSPDFIFTISLEDGHLFIQAPRQPKLELFAESEAVFFLRVVDAQVTFLKEAGEVTHLILLQGGREMKAQKLEE